jgi:mannose-6-phosphate isomerase-like protein (cupin superfamily)
VSVAHDRSGHNLIPMRRLLTSLTLAALLTGARASSGQEPVFRGNIQQMTQKNTDFRRVLFTGRNVQIVAMALRAGEEIGEEVHKVDQCFFFVEGKAKVIAKGTFDIGEDGVVCVPAGTRHNIRNAGSGALKLYTIYAPPQHAPKTVHHTKADAERSETKPLPKMHK